MPLAPPTLDPHEARQILMDPALCRNRPSLRNLAWYTMATARGRPARQIARAHNPTSGDAA